MLKVNDSAPLHMTVVDETGTEKTLQSYLDGQKFLVVYFYPKDDTPGCTKEACSFRDDFDVLRQAGVAVIGVSKDSVESHQRFQSKFTLPFPLIADENHALAEAFGVWMEKKMFGKSYMGMQRATFLIDAKGIVQKVWPKVKPADHAQDILKAVEKL